MELDRTFFHFRLVNQKPKLNPKTGLPMDLINPKGGVTVCVRQVNETEAAIGMAVCFPGDAFEKTTAKNKALGRSSAQIHKTIKYDRYEAMLPAIKLLVDAKIKLLTERAIEKGHGDDWILPENHIFDVCRRKKKTDD